jgi:DNA-binding winged helix-turn-helix (wHTH) protein
MRYRFNGFEIDARRYELRRDGALRHVEPLVFDLLHFLAVCRTYGTRFAAIDSAA